MREKIETVGRLRYQDTRDNIGRNASAVIYIPEEIIRKKNRNGLTLYLNLFWICKDLLHFRDHVEHKIAVSSNPKDVRIGDKDYNAPYIKTEITVPEQELARISELIEKRKGGDRDR